MPPNRCGEQPRLLDEFLEIVLTEMQMRHWGVVESEDVGGRFEFGDSDEAGVFLFLGRRIRGSSGGCGGSDCADARGDGRQVGQESGCPGWRGGSDRHGVWHAYLGVLDSLSRCIG